MSINELLKLQPHLAEGDKLLSSDQLERFTPALLEEQRTALSKSTVASAWEPLTHYNKPDPQCLLQGQLAISQGKTACVILAGGQGSRLGSSQPKALFPITPVRHKTLLQRVCERTFAASHAFQTPLQIAVMASPLNFEALDAYLQEHQYFGLSEEQVHLFVQETAPFLDDSGNWFLEAPGRIAAGPDGNGHCLRHLMHSGIAQRWKAQGIEMISIIPIDNPLADPFDATFFGYHAMSSQEATLKAILRNDPHEKVGIVVWKEGKITVQEYLEVSFPCDAPLGYIGLLCLTLPFIERISALSLPWHFARKQHGGRGIWKCERFLFDILSYTTRSGVIAYPREDTYAPLKNAEGPHSVEGVQQALVDFDCRFLSRFIGASIQGRRLELDPAFYYSTPVLKQIWQGKSLPPDDYISPDFTFQ